MDFRSNCVMLFAVLFITCTSIDGVYSQGGRETCVSMLGSKQGLIQECIRIGVRQEPGLLESLSTIPYVFTMDHLCKTKDISLGCFKQWIGECIDDKEEDNFDETMRRNSFDCSALDRSEEVIAITCDLSSPHVTSELQACIQPAMEKLTQATQSQKGILVEVFKQICPLVKDGIACAKRQNCLRLKPELENLINDYMKLFVGCEVDDRKMLSSQVTDGQESISSSTLMLFALILILHFKQ